MAPSRETGDRADQKPRARLVRVAGLALVVAFMAGCASSNDAQKALNPDPPGQMYAEADRLLQKGSWTAAAQRFEDLDRDHPYAPEARRSLVMSAYAYYKAGKFPEAIANARRYTTMHPGTKEAALAHHIIASANFDEIRDPARDQTATRKALAELKTLKQRYPESPYSKQAENRIRIAEDVLAASEMNVGRYYLKRSNHVAAINRFKIVVAEFQTTAHVEEALYRIVEGNMALGVVQEAQAAGAVLGHNFPDSAWYKDAHALLKSGGVAPSNSPASWIAQTWKSIAPGSKQEPAPQRAPEGLPQPDQLPAPRGGDVPVAQTGKPKMGVGAAASLR
jgi:outer membrane protein assembly factor BamD